MRAVKEERIRILVDGCHNCPFGITKKCVLNIELGDPKSHVNVSEYFNHADGLLYPKECLLFDFKAEVELV